MVTEYPSLGEYNKLPILNFNNLQFNNHEQEDFKITLNQIDYYKTNIIARSSKQCMIVKKTKIATKKVNA